ncbi:hypothetical protein PXC01_00610 [Maribacter sp. M208]|uniref:hypothetical protein n=1 Tax=Maribacter huludaoensis TaxID=3030010 RepID=UPI0023EC221E|nr:hypothetical protein [Maribacter huludaoensis]MDF4220066.1 hypothetical protein [Maribacter huludaoensis]
MVNQPTSLFFADKMSLKFWKLAVVYTFASIKCQVNEVKWVFWVLNKPSGLFFGSLNELFQNPFSSLMPFLGLISSLKHV